MVEKKGFHSASLSFIAKLKNDYNPIIVQSKDEWEDMVKNAATMNSLVVRTLILPQGVSIFDKRILTAPVSSVKKYTKERGEYFENPNACYIADIDGDFVNQFESIEPNVDTRYQILEPSDVERSIEERRKIHRRTQKTNKKQRNIFLCDKQSEDRKSGLINSVVSSYISFFGTRDDKKMYKWIKQ